MALDDDITLLEHVPLFASLGQDPLRLLAFSAETRMLGSGDILFREGQAADSGFVVVEGGFILSNSGGLGDRAVGPGALLGEIALIVATLRPATAIAREPSTVMRIPRMLFRRVLAEFPAAARRVHAEFHQKMQRTTESLTRVGRMFETIDTP
ncbi:cyclic nucleotide-binding domain-containing protein [Phreatobacter aquaticus]|uniref:Cyclic nucleotide-binding domain-containing protein n=1 Tax=Phreatobacter aquaticus TaxID=2570229 RepID=A0A4D7QLZ7_9HYPH|nr:cyclic nucleotide-binding domain-containing protein [Phreatobacter aquaticus]QCK85262.1 cyclic nucleotide-binding domain-containing protein [Phreatobacter aquaticus]